MVKASREGVRWVLDLMRGTEFAGRTITSYEITTSRAVTEIVLPRGSQTG